MIRICDASPSPDANEILKLQDVIEPLGEAAAKAASVSFQPMIDIEWQKFRMVIFYFLLDLERADADRST